MNAAAENVDLIHFQIMEKGANKSLNGHAVSLGENTTSLAVSEGVIEVPKSLGQVSLEFKSEGYFSSKMSYDLDTMSVEDVYEIALEPLSEGNVITLEHVLFYRGTANFIEGSEEELD